MSNGKVHGRVVAVTGASGGVGRAVVREFAKRGGLHRAAGSWRSRAGCGRGGGDCSGSNPDGGACRCRRPSFQIEAAVARIENELGPIDIWVNSAFTSIFAPFAEISPEEFKRVTEVTYLGAVYATMAVLRRMRERDAGDHRASRLHAGVPRDSASDRVLRCKTCTARFPRVAALRAAARSQQCPGDDGAAAGGEHSAVLLGAVPAPRARAAGAADLPT